MASDADGFLAGFGRRCTVKGSEYLGIFDDGYDLADPGGGRIRVASSAIEILFTKRGIRRMGLAIGDTVSVYDDDSDVEAFTDYTVRSLQPQADEFTRVKLAAQT